MSECSIPVAYSISLVFYNSMVLIIPLSHLGDDRSRRQIIYVYCFRLRLSRYFRSCEFYNRLQRVKATNLLSRRDSSCHLDTSTQRFPVVFPRRDARFFSYILIAQEGITICKLSPARKCGSLTCTFALTHNSSPSRGTAFSGTTSVRSMSKRLVPVQVQPPSPHL